MKPLVLLLTGMLGAAAATHAADEQTTLVINELMQSNIDCTMDDLNDFPDSWVELYNPTSASMNLGEYRIGLSNRADEAWKLPFKTVEGQRYVVVYCDKVGDGMHTDFRLDSGKGSVYLFKGTEVVDEISVKKQPAPNIAYGRQTDGSSEMGYQLVPTPGVKNYGTLSLGVLGEPVFSQKGLVVTDDQPMELALSVPEGSPEGTTIRYTVNGSEPTASSILYTKPIDIPSTRIVRAKLFCNGYVSPRSTCHSYIFFPTTRELTLPVISIMTDNRYLNDQKIGIYVDGTYSSKQKNYEYDWRRPMNIELFEQGGKKSVINQLGEMRIAGGATRSSKMKSLIIYANKRFGTKRLNYEFFPDQKPGLKDFKSIMLRNAGNDFDYLYMRDAIIQRTMAQHVDLDWQAWRPAIIYINGQYKGMLNIRERSNEDNIYTNYDGLEDIDMFENGELKEGTWDRYIAFKAFYNNHGHTLAEYAEWMDWKEYINLMIENLYYCNLDFPGNNNVIWRPRTEDGKWRWITKDTDFGLGLYGCSADYNTIKWIYNPNYDPDRAWANKSEHTRLFRRLMEDADFSREFIDRAAIYMGDFLNEKGTRAVWDPMYDMIKTEYPHHRKLINEWWPNYSEELNNARNWIKQRTTVFYKHLADYYTLGKPTVLNINSTGDATGITVNGVDLTQPTFSGKFFANRALTISGQAPEGKRIKGWKLTGALDEERDGSVLTLDMPTSALTINPLLEDATGIEIIQHSTLHTQHSTIYDLQGRKVTTPQAGRIYIRNGKKITWQ